MISLELLRNETARIKNLLAKKDASYDVEKLLSLDAQLRAIRLLVETLRAEKNSLAKTGRDGITDELKKRSIAVGQELKEKEIALRLIETEFQTFYLLCPNIPDEIVPEGGPENNQVVRQWGEKRLFDFPVLHHLELGNTNDWLDFQLAADISGASLALYKSEGAKLLYALSQFMLKHNMQQGYELVLPPVFIAKEALEISGNFPKFTDQVFALAQDDLYLIPTAEVALTSFHKKQIFSAESLPVRYTALTSCFRREGGAYGSHERGLIRMRQFEKVELVTFCTPDTSNAELDRMIATAEGILQRLGLHYRVSLLAAGDCSFQSAKTYDIEVWLPGQKEYREVSSASNCTDFQARRGMMRYRYAQEDKPELVHTLNASSLALPRLMVAIMETYQQADGSIIIPDVLRGYGLYEK